MDDGDGDVVDSLLSGRLHWASLGDVEDVEDNVESSVMGCRDLHCQHKSVWSSNWLSEMRLLRLSWTLDLCWNNRLRVNEANCHSSVDGDVRRQLSSENDVTDSNLISSEHCCFQTNVDIDIHCAAESHCCLC